MVRGERRRWVARGEDPNERRRRAIEVDARCGYRVGGAPHDGFRSFRVAQSGAGPGEASPKGQREKRGTHHGLVTDEAGLVSPCARGIGRAMSTTAARPVASAATHRASPRGVALAAAARPRAARASPSLSRDARVGRRRRLGRRRPDTRRGRAGDARGRTTTTTTPTTNTTTRGSPRTATRDTIVAIATPVVPNAGGVAIIRLSGPRAVEAARAVFRPASRAARAAAREGAPPSSHTALYGVVVDPISVPNGPRRVNDEDVDADSLDVVDEVLVLPCFALGRTPPRTSWRFTATAAASASSVCSRCSPARSARSIQRHSGRPARQARRVHPRAFLNGRLDLAQAEGGASLVTARTERAADGALAALRGGLASPRAGRARDASTCSRSSRRGSISRTSGAARHRPSSPPRFEPFAPTSRACWRRRGGASCWTPA